MALNGSGWMELSGGERRLLAALEDGLPLVSRPYQAVGERVGLGEAEVIETLRSARRPRRDPPAGPDRAPS